jgi:hypothetical protein
LVDHDMTISWWAMIEQSNVTTCAERHVIAARNTSILGSLSLKALMYVSSMLGAGAVGVTVPLAVRHAMKPTVSQPATNSARTDTQNAAYLTALDNAPFGPDVIGGWRFNAGPARDLANCVTLGDWSWAPGAQMVVPKSLGLRLPITIPNKPLLISVRSRGSDQAPHRVKACWITATGPLLPHVDYIRAQTLAALSSQFTDIYLFDRYAVIAINGVWQRVMRYEQPHPGDTLSLRFDAGDNPIHVQSFFVRTITMDDIPEDIREPLKILHSTRERWARVDYSGIEEIEEKVLLARSSEE